MMNAALLAVLISVGDFLVLGSELDADRTTTTRSVESDLRQLIDIADTNTSISTQQKSRRRRYVVFPEGSTFTVAFCVSVKALTGSDPTIFTHGVNWALSYDLPNETRHDNVKKPFTPLKRHKRDLYKRVEILMSSAGFDGRECVLRTICETAQLIQPRQGVIQEIIRILFTYEIYAESNMLGRKSRHREYGDAHLAGTTDGNCYDQFPCPISLLHLLLQFGEKHTSHSLLS